MQPYNKLKNKVYEENRSLFTFFSSHPIRHYHYRFIRAYHFLYIQYENVQNISKTALNYFTILIHERYFWEQYYMSAPRPLHK